MNSQEDMIIDLQTRVAYQEDTLHQLNAVVTRQDGELLLLREQLRSVVQRVEEMSRQPSTGANTMDDERPPHY